MKYLHWKRIANKLKMLNKFCQQCWRRSKWSTDTGRDNRSGPGEGLGEWQTRRVGVRTTGVVLHRWPFITTNSRHWPAGLSSSCSRCSQHASDALETDFAQVGRRFETFQSWCGVNHYRCSTVTAAGTSRTCFCVTDHLVLYRSVFANTAYTRAYVSDANSLSNKPVGDWFARCWHSVCS